jgi:signal transduction histidine kinase
MRRNRFKQFFNKLIPFMVRQAHHERNQKLAVRPELVEGRNMSFLKTLDKGRLRFGLTVFFLCLAIPTGVLVQQSYSHLKWETFHQHQLMAEELTSRINNQLIRLINAEEQRPFTDYAFLNVAGAPSANFIQRSPLSAYPVQSEIPGLLGFFQVDATGNLSTPFVPLEHANKDKVRSYGIVDVELAARLALQQNIEQILQANRLVSRRQIKEEKADKAVGGKAYGRTDSGLAADSERDAKVSSELYGQRENIAASPPTIVEAEGQAVFDELKKTLPNRAKQENNLGKLKDIPLSKNYNAEPAQANSLMKAKAPMRAQTANRKEQAVIAELPESAKPATPSAVQDKVMATQAQPAKTNEVRIRTFESAVDPFEFSQLDSGQFVLFRKVWLNGQRYIQGLLIEKEPFLQGVIKTEFQATMLAEMSNLLVVFQGDVLTALSGRSPRGYVTSASELNGELLYQAQLSDPLNELQLVFSITQLPVGSGGWMIIWLTLILTIVLVVGFYMLYRLSVGQINLVKQQQDFVSAVSHELKTPLTSIRMYGEMLQAGWVEEAKKKSYYDFISAESERLSRLINNVLQLAKLTRNTNNPELKTLTVAEALDGIRSKVSSQIERAGFVFKQTCEPDVGKASININPDWFAQILINLVDNALKFSAKAENKTVEISCRRLSSGQIQFAVRDHGPGIAKDQLKKIFKLFYRVENELTRETVGTGIGLALSHQMTGYMNGEIDVVNRYPGAEFRVFFPSDKFSK